MLKIGRRKDETTRAEASMVSSLGAMSMLEMLIEAVGEVRIRRDEDGVYQVYKHNAVYDPPLLLAEGAPLGDAIALAAMREVDARLRALLKQDEEESDDVSNN